MLESFLGDAAMAIESAFLNKQLEIRKTTDDGLNRSPFHDQRIDKVVAFFRTHYCENTERCNAIKANSQMVPEIVDPASIDRLSIGHLSYIRNAWFWHILGVITSHPCEISMFTGWKAIIRLKIFFHPSIENTGGSGAV